MDLATITAMQFRPEHRGLVWDVLRGYRQMGRQTRRGFAAMCVARARVQQERRSTYRRARLRLLHDAGTATQQSPLDALIACEDREIARRMHSEELRLSVEGHGQRRTGESLGIGRSLVQYRLERELARLRAEAAA